MEHPFFPTTTTRAEALRWLTIAEKLLSARDLMGSKSFASRARDSDPTLTPADQILAVVDTLLAGDRRIGNNQQDLYAILRLTPQQGRESELIATQYRNLAILLNPQKNKFPFAEQAFRLTVDAWTILSNPSRKAMYDKELAFYLQPHQQQPDPFINPNPAMHQNFIFFGGGSSSGGVTHPTQPSQPQGPVHFSQVPAHASPQVDPVGGGSNREAQNFMSFPSGSNLVFGGSSGSKAGQETVNKQVHESYPTYTGNVVASAPEEHNYSNVGEKTGNDVNESENLGEEGEGMGDEEDGEGIGAQDERMGAPENENDVGLSFWTACPYCYYMYEYPRKYVDCTLRCQHCRKAFEGVVISSPPPIVDGQDGYFCCWGFFPLGFSMENWEKNKGAASSWTPFSPMFTCPKGGSGQSGAKRGGGRKYTGPRVYIDDDDDEVFVEVSDSSDDDWNKEGQKRKKKTRSVKAKGASGTTTRSAKKAQADKGKNVALSLPDENANAAPPPNGVEAPAPASAPASAPNKTAGDSSKKGAAVNARKQPGRVAKNFGKLDLNVEFSNEAEEPAASRVNQGNGPSRGEDDNIEGIGFFEGLDEFLSSLPILNVVGEDKVVKAA